MQSRLVCRAALPLLFVVAPFSLCAQETLDPVVVTATRQATPADELLADVSVLERDDIERNAGSTIAELLQREPGVQMARTGGPGTATSLYLRGAKSDQTRVLVDGVPVNSLDASGSALPNLSLADVERIEIVRGPASTLYGADAIGGVIQLFTRQGRAGVHTDAFAGYGSHGNVQASLGVAAGGERWRLRVGAEHAGADGISAQVDASNRDADQDSWRNRGLASSFAVLPAAGHEVGGSWRRNEGRTHYDSGFVPAAGDFNDRVKFQAQQWQIYAQDQLTTRWHSTIRYGEARDEQTYFSEWSPEGSLLRTENQHLGWQHDVTLSLGSLLLAAERFVQRAAPRDSFDGDDSARHESLQAGWSGGSGRQSWQLNARRDWHSAFGAQNSYAVAYGWRLTEHWRLRGGLATAFKAPSLYQLYAPFYGNSNLQPEKARNRELALTFSRGTHVVEVTGYRNRVRNLIDWVLIDPLIFAGRYENVARATLRGATVTYDGRLGAWNLKASYDRLNARDQSSDLRLGRRARDTAQVGLSNAWGVLQLGAEWTVAGSRFDSNAETGRMGGYGLVNLTFGYAIGESLRLTGRIDNLLDKPYELARGYGTTGTTVFLGLRHAPR